MRVFQIYIINRDLVDKNRIGKKHKGPVRNIAYHLGKRFWIPNDDDYGLYLLNRADSENSYETMVSK